MKDDTASTAASVEYGAPTVRPDLDDRMASLEAVQRLHHAELCTRLDGIVESIKALAADRVTERDRVDNLENDIVKHRAKLSALDASAVRRIKGKK